MQWRPIRPVLLLVILVAGVGVAGAAGTGTFILQDTIAGVGERAGTTLSLNTTWDPPASELWMTLRFDPAIVRYEDSRSLVGGTFSATRIRAGSILVLVSDPARFRTGPLVEFEFSGLTNGTSPLELEIGHVRAYPEGRPVDLADTAFIRQGTFVVLAGSPATPTAVIPTTVTSNRTPVAVMTSPPPLLPLTLPSPSMLPTTILLGDDYTGAVSQTPTPYPTGTMPVGNRTVLEIITRNPDFSIFTRAVNEANVTAVLDGPGPVTVFVPTDAAFSSLPPGTLEELFADETELKVLIGYHLAPGTRSVADITSSAFVPTLLDEPLRVTVRAGGRVEIDGANLTLLDIPAKNGIVHIVDGVLFPPGRAPSPAPTPLPTEVPPPTTLIPVTRSGHGMVIIVVAVLVGAALPGLRRRRYKGGSCRG